jgi:hypothetical protein
VYHLQLRQFPNHATRFNISEEEVRAVLEPWVRQQIVEVGERKWAPERATLTVLEGPKLEIQDLALGRGWRAAERSGEDVTERMLAAVAHALASAAPAVPPAAGPTPAVQPPSAVQARDAVQGPGVPGPSHGAPPPADPLALAVQLASLLGNDPELLLAAWRKVAARSSGLAPSEALALAERQAAQPPTEEG